MQASRPASPRFLRDLTDFAPRMRRLQQHRPRSFDRLEKVIRDGIKAGAFNDISPKLVAELILMAAVDSSIRPFNASCAESAGVIGGALLRLLRPRSRGHQKFGDRSKVARRGRWCGAKKADKTPPAYRARSRQGSDLAADDPPITKTAFKDFPFNTDGRILKSELGAGSLSKIANAAQFLGDFPDQRQWHAP